MHPAVELLISRMKTNPEDFKGNSKWYQAYNDYKKHFSKEDIIAAEQAYKEMRMVQFQGRLFDLMAREEEPQPIGLDMYGKPMNGFGLTPTVMSGQSTTYVSPIISEEEKQEMIEMIKQQMEESKLEMQREIHNSRL